MRPGEQLSCRCCVRPMMCERAQVGTRSNCPLPMQSNFNHYSFVQPSATRPPSQIFPSPPSPALRNDTLLPRPPPPSLHPKFSIFLWRLTAATTTLDSSSTSTALPPAKSRRRSEPFPLSLDADQNRCGRLSSGGAGGWDLKKARQRSNGSSNGGGRAETSWDGEAAK